MGAGQSEQELLIGKNVERESGARLDRVGKVQVVDDREAKERHEAPGE